MRRALVILVAVAIVIVLVLAALPVAHDEDGDGNADESSDFTFDPVNGDDDADATDIHGTLLYRLIIYFKDGTSEQITQQAPLFSLFSVFINDKEAIAFSYDLSLRLECACTFSANLTDGFAQASVVSGPTILSSTVTTFAQTEAKPQVLPPNQWIRVLPYPLAFPSRYVDLAIEDGRHSGEIHLVFSGQLSLEASVSPYENPWSSGWIAFKWPDLKLGGTTPPPVDCTQDPALGSIEISARLKNSDGTDAGPAIGVIVSVNGVPKGQTQLDGKLLVTCVTPGQNAVKADFSGQSETKQVQVDQSAVATDAFEFLKASVPIEPPPGGGCGKPICIQPNLSTEDPVILFGYTLKFAPPDPWKLPLL